MRCLALLLLLTALSAADVVSDAADAALAAFRKHDEKALRALTRPKGFDAWFILDELCQREEADAAAALAALAPGEEGRRMQAHVAWLRKRGPDPAAKKARAAGRLARAKPAEALALLEGVRSFGDDVSAYRIFNVRAYALRQLGRLEESEKAALAAGAVAGRMGWPRAHADGFDSAGRAACDAWQYERAVKHWRNRIKHTDPDRRKALGKTYGNVASALAALGRYDEAMKNWDRSLELATAAVDHHTRSRTLGHQALVWFSRGRADRARACAERGLAAARDARSAPAASFHVDLLGTLLAGAGRYDEALRHHEQALVLAQQGRHAEGAARVLDHIGRVHTMRGEYAQARRALDRSLALHRFTSTLASLVHLHLRLGDYDQAIAYGEEGLAAARRANDESGRATLLQRLGEVYLKLGDSNRAFDLLREALAVRERRGEKVHVVLALVGLASARARRHEHDQALELFERAIALETAMDLKANLPGHVADMALVLERLGRIEKAIEGHEGALQLNREFGRRHWTAINLFNLGRLHLQAGRLDEAERVLQEAMALETPAPTRASLLLLDAELEQRRGRLKHSLARLREAAALLEPTLHGLADEEGASVRDTWAPAFARGAAIAASLDDVATATSFLERGRAGTLVEDLGGRTAIRKATLPDELLRADEEAVQAERDARRRLAAARKTGRRADMKAARAALVRAQEHRRQLAATMQRRAKAGAGIVLGKAASLAEIQTCLRETDALVVYSRSDTDVLALVVRRKKARTVRLGAPHEIEAALDDPAVLRGLLIDPLKLDATVKRLYVSPFGSLAYVPFVLLVPDRELAYIPSGTVFRHLRGQADARGEGVLALGDPTQAELAPLPASRAEAKAVGSRLLLGDDATRTALLKAVPAQSRWRSIHIACHGRPRALLLADGWLTIREINRWNVVTDLVVLSACDTARGTVYRAEGVLGLPRAFFLAGAPRVIVSLWEVDDAATHALMVKFYELWDKHPTAAALKKAQEFVRGHDKWKHPRYWAAWQLWGLGD